MFGFFEKDYFTISKSTKIIAGVVAAGILLFGLGYALRPVAEIVDELHDSNEDSDEESE